MKRFLMFMLCIFLTSQVSAGIYDELIVQCEAIKEQARWLFDNEENMDCEFNLVFAYSAINHAVDLLKEMKPDMAREDLDSMDDRLQIAAESGACFFVDKINEVDEAVVKAKNQLPMVIQKQKKGPPPFLKALVYKPVK